MCTPRRGTQVWAGWAGMPGPVRSPGPGPLPCASPRERPGLGCVRPVPRSATGGRGGGAGSAVAGVPSPRAHPARLAASALPAGLPRRSRRLPLCPQRVDAHCSRPLAEPGPAAPGGGPPARTWPLAGWQRALAPGWGGAACAPLSHALLPLEPSEGTGLCVRNSRIDGGGSLVAPLLTLGALGWGTGFGVTDPCPLPRPSPGWSGLPRGLSASPSRGGSPPWALLLRRWRPPRAVGASQPVLGAVAREQGDAWSGEDAACPRVTEEGAEGGGPVPTRPRCPPGCPAADVTPVREEQVLGWEAFLCASGLAPSCAGCASSWVSVPGAPCTPTRASLREAGGHLDAEVLPLPPLGVCREGVWAGPLPTGRARPSLLPPAPSHPAGATTARLCAAVRPLCLRLCLLRTPRPFWVWLGGSWPRSESVSPGRRSGNPRLHRAA